MKRTRLRGIVVLVVAATLPWWGTAKVSAQESPTAEVSGRGSVQLTSVSVALLAPGSKSFRADLQPADASTKISGTVTLTGVARFSGGSFGDITWTRTGSLVTGTVSKQGREVAHFSGTISSDNASGTFTSNGGQTGTWSWQPEQIAQ